MSAVVSDVLGSSPRMRGTQTILPSSRLAAGIIPAYAGNTSTHTPRNLISRDHPRVCGEHIRERLHGGEISGSSPRMRGTRSTRTTRPAHGGIIPAYAGNTWPQPRIRPDGRDHPRVCGEHLPTASVFHPLTGSSPRMRGTRIPCYRSAGANRDHPRVCGEHLRAEIYCSILWGSSPRMRGTRHHRFRRGVGPWIIPAYAGNTRLSSKKGYPSGDHPRVCGEHALFASAKADPLGSSPRMRGTRAVCKRQSRPVGIIPAYAGNTLSPFIGLSPSWDHPRVCGEHCIPWCSPIC